MCGNAPHFQGYRGTVGQTSGTTSPWLLFGARALRHDGNKAIIVFQQLILIHFYSYILIQKKITFVPIPRIPTQLLAGEQDFTSYLQKLPIIFKFELKDFPCRKNNEASKSNSFTRGTWWKSYVTCGKPTVYVKLDNVRWVFYNAN